MIRPSIRLGICYMFLYASYNTCLFIIPNALENGVVGLLLNFTSELIGLMTFQYFVGYNLQKILMGCCLFMSLLVVSNDISANLYFAMSIICGFCSSFLSLIQGIVVLDDVVLDDIESDDVTKFNRLYALSFIMGPLVCFFLSDQKYFYIQICIVSFGVLSVLCSWFVSIDAPLLIEKITFNTFLNVTMFLHGYNEGLFYVTVPLSLSDISDVLLCSLIYGVSLFVFSSLIGYLSENLMIVVCLLLSFIMCYLYLDIDVHYIYIAIICGYLDNCLLLLICNKISASDYAGYSFLWILGYICASIIVLLKVSDHTIYISLGIFWFFGLFEIVNIKNEL